MELWTVGRVSGLIALGHSVVGFLIPLLVALLLVRNLDRRMSAATWTVVAATLHASSWPSLLGTDSAAVKNVHRSISIIGCIDSSLFYLGFISGVVTPLGLYEEVQALPAHRASFAYAPDFSAFGNNTMPGPEIPLSRNCGSPTSFCPGAIPQKSGNISTKIPHNITDFFTSAPLNATVANIFEIQYRTWLPHVSKNLNDGHPYPRGHFRHLDSLLQISRQQGSSYIVIEGAIADLNSGGLGFRNHTVPAQTLPHGAEWDEDILWIQPEVACSPANVSLEMTLGDVASATDIIHSFVDDAGDDPQDPDELPQGVDDPIQSLDLVDDGGFSEMPDGDPRQNWSEVVFSGSQVLDLRAQTERSAWLSNIMIAQMLNLTSEMSRVNSTVGRRFALEKSGKAGGIAATLMPLGVQTASIDGAWLNIPGQIKGVIKNESSVGTGQNLDVVSPFKGLNSWCTTGRAIVESPDDYGSRLSCGFFFGPPRRSDGGRQPIQDTGSMWKMPIHVCAGAVRASVRTVSFYKAAGEDSSLQSVTVQRVQEKSYTNGTEPLWAVEDWLHAGSEGAKGQALWGIVDPRLNAISGYTFTRGPSLYLPGSKRLRWMLPRDILAGPVAPFGILNHVLTAAFSAVSNDIPRYKGTDNAALSNRWNTLARTSDGIERLLGLVWTDLMASAAAGRTRSIEDSSDLARRSQGSTTTATTPDGELTQMVVIYDLRIAYDWRYATPALLLCLGLALLLFVASPVTMLSSGGRSLHHIKVLLNDTSVGRLAAAVVDPDYRKYLRASTKEWGDAVGGTEMHLGDKISLP